jgi:hypothetical protein
MCSIVVRWHGVDISSGRDKKFSFFRRMADFVLKTEE